ncbi:Aminopeptidase N (Alpha-aminoacylpeptide hydrolase) [Pseudovibrio sp. FO-BEG1]|uniref:aminopeptidase N n=1 Tax=Pseudovibrio sp. (strain FO-BEG1) TaxID=911045 RepID=UPI000238D1CB|nr:aminopeptidase N [Pseudovibrio sp. FO-BEG1]AEV36998.1 Aminopeptidase N (Alpha-aminoacylpeptide hydrolase) [Pseudovibrio sp. FO-BEG1]
MRSETAQLIKLEDYKETPYVIENVSLVFKLQPEATEVISTLTLSRREGTETGAPLELDGDDLTLVSIAIDGAALAEEAYEASPKKLVVHTPPADTFKLEVVTKVNPTTNTKLEGLYLSQGIYCTQCEAEGFRRITYYYDRPDVLSVFTTRIEADKASNPILLGNGNPQDAGDIEGTDRHFAVWHDPHPKPAYLFALVAGDLACTSEKYTTASGKPVDLNIYVEKGNEDRTDWSMDSLIRSMRWDEKVFGREYDLDVFNIVAVSAFNMGAMENKGLNIFNDKFILADSDTATDTDYEGIETVVAHEYFHNWTGNRITCREWFQLCLKEGLTVFRDQEFSSDERSRPVKRIADVIRLKSRQFPEDQGPLSHPVRPTEYKEINNFYTATVYDKGAELVRMIKTILGADGFRKGMDLYFERHDGDASTIEDFLKCFEDANKLDLSHFSLWYHQSGTPFVKASGSYDEAAKTFTLELEQNTAATPGQDEKKPFFIPIRFGLVGPNGDDLAYTNVEGAKVDGDLLHLIEDKQTVVFHGIGSKPIPSLLREFSAPVKLESTLSREDQIFLMRHDIDPFNRWQATQTLMTELLIELTIGEEPAGKDAFIEALGHMAEDENLDYAFRGFGLMLPSEQDIALEIGKEVDTDAIGKARDAFSKEIGVTLYGTFKRIYDAMEMPATFSPDAQSAGKRALKLRCLSYLGAAQTEESAVLTKAHFDNADNMTDRMGALTVLVIWQLAGAQDALKAFEARHKDTALAMDKWLSIAARAPSEDAIAAIRTLTEHPAFSWDNPNRIYSLIGGFLGGNTRGFHAADGSGYDYLAEITLQLDKTNPQVASRMAKSFGTWKNMNAERKVKAEAALKRILAADQQLSTDVKEIVELCLD